MRLQPPLNSKEDFFRLPVATDRLPNDAFVGQVHFCTDQAHTPDECSFIVIEDTRGGRPQCPQHQRRSMAWANLYEVDGAMRRMSRAARRAPLGGDRG